MSNKLLIISGPTATGKTTLAIKLAKIFNGEIISADSRQIYIGMDIGTGKDHPKNIKIHLTDLITPDQPFSVAQYQQAVFSIINTTNSQGKLPIVVGGSGQYINSIISPSNETFAIKPNVYLRFLLNKLSLNTLQAILKIVNRKVYRSLNNSDIQNPRRLVRKIEISLPHTLFSQKLPLALNLQILHLSLTAPNSYLYQLIDQRVASRLDRGLLKEIEGLLNRYSWSSPGLNTLAYKEFKSHFISRQSNLTTQNSCIQRWRFDEHAYARRQKTYLKKIKNINYFDITTPSYAKKIFSFVSQWYNKS